MFVYWLVALHPSNMRVHLRDGSAQTILRAEKRNRQADRETDSQTDRHRQRNRDRERERDT